jgi:hypothetical protein
LARIIRHREQIIPINDYFIGVIFMRRIIRIVKILAVVFIIIFIIHTVLNNIQFIGSLIKINNRVFDLHDIYLKSFGKVLERTGIDAIINTVQKKSTKNTEGSRPGAASEVETADGKNGQNSLDVIESDDKHHGESGDFFMTFEEMESMENLELLQKLTGVSILSKVAKDDMESIYYMIEGGITYEEMGEIRKLLEKYLSDAEVDTLYEILEASKAINKKEKHAEK